jgi:hypothetical protein
MRLPPDMHDDQNRMYNAAIPVLMANRSRLVPSQVAEESRIGRTFRAHREAVWRITIRNGGIARK